ncbi:MAG: putative helicase [Firmicutes bacterium]|nr:putative helicase [Bacillota bacterium]
MGDLRQDEDEECKPWERSKTNYKLSKSDFPDTVYVTKANMLYISKNGFSHKALNIIKRLAAFRNPDFYKAQAMRLPTFDKPRIISLSDEKPEYLCLPRGCELDLINLLNTHKVDVKWVDKSYSGKRIDVEFNGQLRDEQEDAVDSMIQYDNGI